jgi:hypothetical protein
MFYRKTQFSQIATEFLHALIVTLYGIRSKLTQLVRDPLSFCHLAWPYSGPLLVKYKLELHGEDFAEVVVLLCSWKT